MKYVPNILLEKQTDSYKMKNIKKLIKIKYKTENTIHTDEQLEQLLKRYLINIQQSSELTDFFYNYKFHNIIDKDFNLTLFIQFLSDWNSQLSQIIKFSISQQMSIKQLFAAIISGIITDSSSGNTSLDLTPNILFSALNYDYNQLCKALKDSNTHDNIILLGALTRARQNQQQIDEIQQERQVFIQQFDDTIIENAHNVAKAFIRYNNRNNIQFQSFQGDEKQSNVINSLIQQKHSKELDKSQRLFNAIDSQKRSEYKSKYQNSKIINQNTFQNNSLLISGNLDTQTIQHIQHSEQQREQSSIQSKNIKYQQNKQFEYCSFQNILLNSNIKRLLNFSDNGASVQLVFNILSILNNNINCVENIQISDLEYKNKQILTKLANQIAAIHNYLDFQVIQSDNKVKLNQIATQLKNIIIQSNYKLNEDVMATLNKFLNRIVKSCSQLKVQDVTLKIPNYMVDDISKYMEKIVSINITQQNSLTDEFESIQINLTLFLQLLLYSSQLYYYQTNKLNNKLKADIVNKINLLLLEKYSGIKEQKLQYIESQQVQYGNIKQQEQIEQVLYNLL